MHPWSRRHPVAAQLEATAPGPRLAAAVVDVALVEADGVALVEVVAACERLISWASAVQASAVAEMTRRAASGREVEFVGDEVAARLATTRRSADLMMELAAGLQRVPAVQAALTNGEIDVRKATVLTAGTAHLGAAAAEALLAGLVPRAPEMTGPQLRAALRRAELAMDPDSARSAHDRARADRSVTMTPARARWPGSRRTCRPMTRCVS